MVQIIPNNVFSGVRPDTVQCYPDQVVVNSNIRYVEKTSEEGDESYYIADSIIYSTDEYASNQIAELKSTSDEHDELIAELLEA